MMGAIITVMIAPMMGGASAASRGALIVGALIATTGITIAHIAAVAPTAATRGFALLA